MSSKFLTLITEVVGLHAIEAGAGVGVEVNTDKNSVAVAIGDICAAPERDELITAACHGDRHALCLEHFLH